MATASPAFVDSCGEAGNVGRAAIRAVAANPAFGLVGVVANPAKVLRDGGDWPISASSPALPRRTTSMRCSHNRRRCRRVSRRRRAG
ncbi:hypothetical protein [Rhodococcus sp. 27YEA15]|uniref:hypothetical protein n=1 Tax=Rhodococcus sp. 27YEA15 TaxID=3156259 RepID=UPI003C7D3D83